MSELKPRQMTMDEAIGALRGLKMMVGMVGKEALDIAISALRRAQPDNDKVRLIDANTLSDEISRLQISLAGESLFTPAIKETILRTIDEQATVAMAQPREIDTRQRSPHGRR